MQDLELLDLERRFRDMGFLIEESESSERYLFVMCLFIHFITIKEQTIYPIFVTKLIGYFLARTVNFLTPLKKSISTMLLKSLKSGEQNTKGFSTLSNSLN